MVNIPIYTLTGNRANWLVRTIDCTVYGLWSWIILIVRQSLPYAPVWHQVALLNRIHNFLDDLLKHRRLQFADNNNYYRIDFEQCIQLERLHITYTAKHSIYRMPPAPSSSIHRVIIIINNNNWNQSSVFSDYLWLKKKKKWNSIRTCECFDGFPVVINSVVLIATRQHGPTRIRLVMHEMKFENSVDTKMCPLNARLHNFISFSSTSSSFAVSFFSFFFFSSK